MRPPRRISRKQLLCVWVSVFVLVAYWGAFEALDGEVGGGGESLATSSLNTTALDWEVEKEAVLRDNSFLEISTEAAKVLHKLNEPYWRRHKHFYGEEGSRIPIEKEHSFHIFYTVDCTQHSVWQSLALEKSWEDVKQPGALTRIIGNCVNIRGRIATTIERVNRTITSPSLKSFLFYAPSVNTKISGENYSPLNRPSSVFYWLANADPQEEVLALVDPDMIILKPLVQYTFVQPGRPFGQYYGYMEHRNWIDHYKKVCGSAPYSGNLIPRTGKDCSIRGPRKAWATGPPHYMAKDDWYIHVLWWLRYTVGMKQSWGDWVSEMAGFSSALITMNIHTRTTSGITWERASDVNKHLFSNLIQPPEGHLDSGIEAVPSRYLPNILHYCVTFEVGRQTNPQSLWRYAGPQIEWEQQHLEPLIKYMHWSKYRVPTDWGGVVNAETPIQKTLLDCEQPLLLEYPSLTRMVSHYRSQWTGEDRAWYFFFVSVIPAINRALVTYKTKYCTTYNDALLWRTAHDQKWMSHYFLSPNVSDPRGFSYKKVA